MVRSEGNMSLKNPVTPPGIDPGTVRLVVQSLKHYATPGPYVQRNEDVNTSVGTRKLRFFLFFVQRHRSCSDVFRQKQERYELSDTVARTVTFIQQEAVIKTQLSYI
jgi:hypothetical protein